MASRRNIRRSAANWQQLVDQQKGSGLSATAFCKQNDLPYASFIQWRRRLRHSEPSCASMPRSEIGFIELTSPLGQSEPIDRSESPERWLIELDLGAGVQLRIGQAR